MEQRDSIPLPRSTSQAQQTRPNKNSSEHREPHLAASLPTPSTTTSLASAQQPPTILTDGFISSSEPFLRFPRPQGNKRLANWISSSEPNIMDLASETNSEAGLAGSTFELIDKDDSITNSQNAGTDSESQDDSQNDFFEGSMGESVGSLDQFRQDDVHSLASTSTDHIEDDEEEEGIHPHYEDNHEEIYTTLEDNGSRFTDVTLVNKERQPLVSDNAEDGEEHSDAESRSSIEYTRQSLGTPSILTPEASKILNPAQDEITGSPERTRPSKSACTTSHTIVSKLATLFATAIPPRPARGDKRALDAYCKEHYFAYELWRAADIVMKNPKQIAVSVLTLVLASLMLGYSQRLPSLSAARLEYIAVETSTTTTTVIVESTVLVQPAETKSAVHPSTGVALIHVHESHGDEGLFGYSMPTVAFTPQGDSGVLIHVEPSIPKTWTAQRECVKIHATRGNKAIPLNIDFSSANAIRIEFSKVDAHGIVNIKLSSKCRPKFEKSVKVHFGKGVVEQMVDCAGELAHALMGLQFSHISTANHCKVLKSVSDDVDHRLMSAKDKGYEFVTSQLDAATRLLGPLGDNMVKASHEAGRRLHQAEEVLKSVSDRTDKPWQVLRRYGTQIAQSSLVGTGAWLSAARDNVAHSAQTAFHRAAASQRAHQANLKQVFSHVDLKKAQDQLRFGLLGAQVAAKTWWLKITGREDQSSEYGRRAKKFIDELRALSFKAASSAEKGKPKVWKGQQCKSTGGGRGRNTHRCDPVA